MESTYMLNNLGSLLLIYLSYPVLLILYRGVYTFRNCSYCCKKTQKRLQKKLFYGMAIVTIVESYAILALCCIVALYSLDFTSLGLIVQSVSCIFFTLILILLPLFIYRLFNKYFNILGNRKVSRRYGSLYDDLELTRSKYIYLQPFFFLIRRLILAIAVTVT